jgi:probable phosphoglycerate mutase
VRLLLVRHGDAHAGFHGVIGGPRGCTGLTALGRAQAGALRDRFARSISRADVLLTSVLPRAVETATIIGPGLGLEIHAEECDLCEVHTGEADGLTWAEYADRHGSFDMEAQPDRVFAPSGDSWNSFHGRVEQVLQRIAREYQDQTVVAVCHAGVIMASLRVLLGIAHPSTGARLRPTNTGVTVWEHDPVLALWSLHTFNDAGHLTEILGEAETAPIPGSESPIVGRSGAVSELSEFSVDSARQAAERDELAEWVAEFLASAGSDNAALAEQLTEAERWWLGPLQLPIDELHRLAGPPDAPVLEVVEEDEWRDDVEDLAEEVEDEADLPPVIVSHREGQLVLEDGNHRVEALRRAGIGLAWGVIAFDDPGERDRFVAPDPARAGTPGVG